MRTKTTAATHALPSGEPYVGKMPTQPLPSSGARSGERIKSGYMTPISLGALATRYKKKWAPSPLRSWGAQSGGHNRSHTTHSIFGRRMWTAWLTTPSYLEDPSHSKKIRRAFTTLVFLEVYLKTP